MFHRPRKQDADDIALRLGLDRSTPIIGLLTNVTWDAQLHYPANAFPNMLEWLIQTCQYFATRPDLKLLIRVHPAEISGFPPSRQPILGELYKAIPRLAPNIIVVPPESDMSTYALMSLCNAAIIYGTKMGVELTSAGLPVIVAGEAWIRNKGLTRDASSPAEYFRILSELPFAERLSGTQLARARRYAYHFFFNRMIPLWFHRSEGRVSDLPARARPTPAAAARCVGRTGYNLRRHSPADGRSSCIRVRRPLRWHAPQAVRPLC